MNLHNELLDGPITLDPAQLDELRQFACFLATTAAAHVRRRRVELGLDLDSQTETKSSDVDPVTVVDKESEELIRHLVATQRPDDAVLGEEQGGGEEVRPGTVRWLVDPIDGTVNFLYGVPAYAVSVGCEVDGRLVAGAVADIPHNRVYHAAAAQGAAVTEADGRSRPIECSRPAGLDVSLLATGFSYDAQRRRKQGLLVTELLGHVRDIRRMGSAALDLCMLADGQLDCYLEHGLNLWDYAAGAVIAIEAGAVVTLPAPGSSTADGRAVVATAHSVAGEFNEILGAMGALEPIDDHE
ncbi:inositol monophosphatase family protein [Corynebacterium sp. H113]|uniref:inositol monophosphatase family protein n=1 Tax=Corynebacterium sp. H113 TaxID=3133419 RepID=UPI0030AD5B32